MIFQFKIQIRVDSKNREQHRRERVVVIPFGLVDHVPFERDGGPWLADDRTVRLNAVSPAYDLQAPRRSLLGRLGNPPLRELRGRHCPQQMLHLQVRRHVLGHPRREPEHLGSVVLAGPADELVVVEFHFCMNSARSASIAASRVHRPYLSIR